MAFAQDETPTAVTVQNRTGDLPFSQTVGTGVEHVDIGSGNLIVDFPIVSLPGRHMAFNYGLRYNALFWAVATRTQTNGQQLHFWNIERRPYIGGVNNGLGFTPTQAQLSWGVSSETCTNVNGTPPDTKTTASGYIYTDAGGGKHFLPIVQVSASTPEGGCFAGQDGTGFFQGFSPGEGIFARVSDIYSTPAVYLPDGTQVAWPTDNSILNPPATPDGWAPIYLAQYLDTNGNSKCEDPAHVACNPTADTLGRNPLTIVNGSNQILYQVYDSDGVQRTYTVNLGTISVHTNFGIAGVTEHSQTRTVVTSIGLPNGTSYSFQYENGTYGGLTGITLPTGATISYTWATLSPAGNPYLTHRFVSGQTVTVGSHVSPWTFSKSCVENPEKNRGQTERFQIFLTADGSLCSCGCLSTFPPKRNVCRDHERVQLQQAPSAGEHVGHRAQPNRLLDWLRLPRGQRDGGKRNRQRKRLGHHQLQRHHAQPDVHL
jgi:hypothetical protein